MQSRNVAQPKEASEMAANRFAHSKQRAKSHGGQGTEGGKPENVENAMTVVRSNNQVKYRGSRFLLL